MAILAPSLLSADFSNLQADIEFVNQSKADWFHLDIMDGVFVPNISFGLPVVKAIKKHAKKPLDVHLMIVNPDAYIIQFKEAGADLLTVHYEACTHLNRTINYTKDRGVKAGVALNPHTPVGVLEEILPYTDLVLIMTVNPGFGGQEFINSSFNKIRKLKDLIIKHNYNTLIEIDGGADLSNAAELINAGVDIIVAGTAIFHSNDPLSVISSFKKIK